MNKSARVLLALQGFTLIEVLLVVSILAIMTATLIPSFDSYIKNQNLKQAQEAVKNDLRTMQNRAMTGASSGSGITYWGIYFADETNSYSLNSTSTPATCAASAESSGILPGDVVMDTTPNPSRCVWFAVGTGDTYSTSEASIYVKSGSICKRVVVNPFGRIVSDPSQVACPQ